MRFFCPCFFEKTEKNGKKRKKTEKNGKKRKKTGKNGKNGDKIRKRSGVREKEFDRHR